MTEQLSTHTCLDKPKFVIQSEVSQKEKNRYCMLMHINGI